MRAPTFESLRELRRQPLRSTATVVVLALSVAALGVLAVPSISSSSLQELAAEDSMAHVTFEVSSTDATGSTGVAGLMRIPGVEAVEARHVGTINVGGGDTVTVEYVDTNRQTVNVISADSGRLPNHPNEALVSQALADAGHDIGSEIEGPDGVLTVVGVGGTAAWDSDPFVALDSDRDAAPAPNTIAVRASDTSQGSLEKLVADARGVLAGQGVSVAALPELNVGGAHPLEAEIQMVAVMIGMLGVVAGIVALVLLASTTSAIIADRSSEVAVLRAMGSGPRATRRRLRQIAMSTAMLAATVGIPLGLGVANLLSRMILERFASVTPAIGFSPVLALGSALFLVAGAWLVSAPAARRVVAKPLAYALRDRDGRPYGGRWYHRAATRIATAVRAPLGARTAGGNALARPGRSVSLALQAGAAVAAVLMVASLGTSLADFDRNELEPWRWDTMTYAANASDGWRVGGGGLVDGPTEESGLFTYGVFDDFEVDVYGLSPQTQVIDPTVGEGRWFIEAQSGGSAGPAEAVVTAGFAEHRGIGLGDVVAIELATGPSDFEIVGIHRLRRAAFLVDTAALGDMMGRPDGANVVWSMGQPGPVSETVAATMAVEVETPADIVEEDRAAREMIMGIFWAIGLIVAAVATIGFASSLQMLVHDRRHELAALRAAGSSRRRLASLVLSEAMGVAVLGTVFGVVAAHFGASALMAFVEASESIEIGYAYATAWVMPVVVLTLTGVALLALLAVRPITSTSPATTLRGAG